MKTKIKPIFSGTSLPDSLKSGFKTAIVLSRMIYMFTSRPYLARQAVGPENSPIQELYGTAWDALRPLNLCQYFIVKKVFILIFL